MRKFGFFFFMALLTLMASACGSFQPGGRSIAKSNLARESPSAVSKATVQALVADNSVFAFNFYNQVKNRDGNLVFSPYSISLATAMLFGGANGNTASQISETVHFNLTTDQIHPAFNALSLDLSQRSEESKKIDRKNPLELYIANSLWGQRDYSFNAAYLDLLAKDYGAGIRLVDFIAKPETARKQINNWVSKETKDKIKDILPPGSIDPYTRLVLANAIYFKAAWENAFPPSLTENAPFIMLDGTEIQVPTMKTKKSVDVRMYMGEAYQAVALPYKGNLAEMVIIMPAQGKFESIENSIDSKKYLAILGNLEQRSTVLYLPRFDFSTDLDLTSILSAMGMPLAFDPENADFSRITNEERFYVQQAIHKAFIQVNEEGTKAAASTIFEMQVTSLPRELHINHPFIFIIQDKPTGTILFSGRVLNPLE